jgi:hypothetical protein
LVGWWGTWAPHCFILLPSLNTFKCILLWHLMQISIMYTLWG